MSDKKHLEYCIRLGNKLIEDKLFQLEHNGYVEQTYNQYDKNNSGNLSFKQRLQNWK